jgi:hypothetical protein
MPRVRYILVPVTRPDPRSEAPVAPAPDDTDPLTHWVRVARAALESCVVLDATGRVAAMSPTACEMLGGVRGAEGRALVDEVLALVDFSDGAQPANAAARRIPPLIAAMENQLSRGIMRVRLDDGRRVMLDAVSTPLHDHTARVVGSLSFLSAV